MLVPSFMVDGRRLMVGTGLQELTDAQKFMVSAADLI
jgi:hypothetical protein